MKKIFSFMLALALVLAMGTTAFAGEISVSNAVKDQTYTAYKIFDVQVVKDTDGKITGYAYTLPGNSTWYDDIKDFPGLTLTQTADKSLYNVSVNENFKPADFAKHLSGKLSGKTMAGESKAEGTDVTITVQEAGYYFVDSTLGSLCVLNTASDNVAIEEKNTPPAITKTIQDEDKVAAIGDEIEYTITINVGTGVDEIYVLKDTMDAGLSYVNDSIKVDGESVSNIPDAKFESTSEQYFELKLPSSYLKDKTSVTVTYKATLNGNVTLDDTYNKNTVELNYKDIVLSSSAETASYQFTLKKVDTAGNELSGAKFKLFDAAEGGNEIKLTEVSDGYYRIALAGETTAEIEAGTVNIKGLDNKKYYLEETTAPTGYNKLTSRVEVLLENGSLTDDSMVQIVNNTGAQLPSTGGMGTTIFYIAGAVLMIGAAVLLITKKRMSAEK